MKWAHPPTQPKCTTVPVSVCLRNLRGRQAEMEGTDSLVLVEHLELMEEMVSWVRQAEMAEMEQVEEMEEMVL